MASLNDTFCQNLERRRLELKISKAQLADKLDCTPGYITQLLTGATNPTLKQVEKIAQLLGVTTGYLLTQATVEEPV